MRGGEITSHVIARPSVHTEQQPRYTRVPARLCSYQATAIGEGVNADAFTTLSNYIVKCHALGGVGQAAPTAGMRMMDL